MFVQTIFSISIHANILKKETLNMVHSYVKRFFYLWHPSYHENQLIVYRGDTFSLSSLNSFAAL